MLDRTLDARLRKTKKHVLLLGARQVGKSTLTRDLSPDFVVNLADERLFLGYAKDPGVSRSLPSLRRRVSRRRHAPS